MEPIENTNPEFQPENTNPLSSIEEQQKQFHEQNNSEAPTEPNLQGEPDREPFPPEAETTPVKKEETFYDRLLNEQAELADKVKKLDTFVSSNPIYANLDQYPKSLTLRQLKAMKEYLDCVNQRVEILKPQQEDQEQAS